VTSERAIRQVRVDMDRLRARLFDLVEVTDMPERQQRAFKGLVRTLTYDSQATLEALLRGRD
jgi:hypothetical protein